jgi:hypothetical protein
MLEKLKTSPSKKIVILITLIAFIPFLILTIIFQLDGAALASSGYGIVSFEFAFSETMAKTMLMAWGPTLIPLVLRGTYMDFGYIASYGFFMMGVMILIVRALQDRWQSIALFCTISPFIAGVFDIVENINLIMMLNDPVGFPSFAPTVASICAICKFGFLLLVIGFAAIAVIALLIRKFRS